MTDSNSAALTADVPGLDAARQQVRAAYRVAEPAHMAQVMAQLDPVRDAQETINTEAGQLIEAVRKAPHAGDSLDDFMNAYDLSTKEGVALMCLAEALLRIPDADTANRLIRDKLGDGEWRRQNVEGAGLFANASAWALMLSGRVLRADLPDPYDQGSILDRLMSRMGQPVIRRAMQHAMRVMSRQFVMGETLDLALARATEQAARRERYSFDMLGEAARSAEDAERYMAAYQGAIRSLAEYTRKQGARLSSLVEAPSISVKLSALYPRYETLQRDRAVPALVGSLKTLCLQARDAGISLCVDAEEARRLDPSLDIIEQLARDPALRDWNGFGLAVQAYQKRALALVDWLAALATTHHRQLLVRLVKGAYWDSEIKWSQEGGYDDYPVFTRKHHTDLSYLACADGLLRHRARLYPQFATHNAHTVCAIRHMARQVAPDEYEFQRLHGMGEELFAALRDGRNDMPGCRVYAPVGDQAELLPYLVRRLLENGANTSFVNRMNDSRVTVAEVIRDPFARFEQYQGQPHHKIRLPGNLYKPQRQNARGLDLNDPLTSAALQKQVEAVADQRWHAEPLIAGQAIKAEPRPVAEPADLRRVIGDKIYAQGEHAETAVKVAQDAFPVWRDTPVDDRARIIERYADLLEQNMARFVGLCATEAGKTFDDGIAEVREAVDFCRYYAAKARTLQSQPLKMPGPTGETNHLSLQGRGVFVCISPWNFPLAIFTGQIAAALISGNTVIAKPAEQTCIIATEAVKLFQAAGLPEGVLSLALGAGDQVGKALVRDNRIAGVAFTGSTGTARIINRTLAAREAPIVPFIAETGGINAMIVDSSALTEQVVDDVLTGAFRSAGQRCSAVRLLFIQDDVAERTLRMMSGAMQALRVGDPLQLSTDVGPVIDADAQHMLQGHIERMKPDARLFVQTPIDQQALSHGTYVAPTLIEIDSAAKLQSEVFGPVLHVVRYQRDHLDKVIEAINATGYGLTFGVHSRIDRVARSICSRINAGNAYINRNTIGAVVGVQPFGGMGLSGTGPKAGGPHYLGQFMTEKHVCINTTAAGGNASLVTLADD